MLIKDNMNFKERVKPVVLAPDDTVSQALEVMCREKVGSVVVVHPDRTVAGIVTERDMVTRVLGDRKPPETTRLSEVMTSPVKVASEEDDLVDWMQTMSSERFRRLPVVDHDGKVMGLISQGDFMAYTWPDLYEKVRRDLRGRLALSFQVLLAVFAVLTLVMIAFNF